MRNLLLLSTVLWIALAGRCFAGELSRIQVSQDNRSFELADSKVKFIPWGFNYDHDESGKLIEDYWDSNWKTIEEDFHEMKQLGANVVRIHLQFGKFMQSPDQPNQHALAQLRRLVILAEQTKLYLNLTGLACYHKQDVPPWYDLLDEIQRWKAQAHFWQAVARQCAQSPAIFCYDLMNEPVVPGGKKKRDDWLGPAFAGKHFVQFITLDAKDRPRHEIARQWIDLLVTAIRKHDSKHLITLGLVHWSLDKPGLTSGFIPEKVTARLDFISVHLYPETGKVDQAIKTLRGFSLNLKKPLVIEETYPLKCNAKQLGQFIDQSKQVACGWFGFYWGKTPQQYGRPKTIQDAIALSWLELFQQKNLALEQ